MSLFFVFLIWYFLFVRNNPKVYEKVRSWVPKIFRGVILFTIIVSIVPMIIPLTFAGVIAFQGIGIYIVIFAVIIKFLRMLLGKGEAPKKKAREKTRKRETDLTRAVPKRIKIVRKFSERYNLNLTEQEIQRIVDASYMSPNWEKEVCDMQETYDTIFEWYRGTSGWLRAYLRVFPVQNVSSDFAMQKQICLDSFERIFSENPPKQYASVDECVEDWNNKYMTAFDETTFMIAYRFLQNNKKEFEMPSVDILRNQSEIDRLKEMYDRTAAADPEPVAEDSKAQDENLRRVQ